MFNKKQNKLTELKNKDICKKYIIYIVKNYGEATKEYISKNEIIFTNLNELCTELTNDKCYHYRIHKETEYIFFGDLDGYNKGIKNFIEILICFMKNTYLLELNETEIYYTENDKKKGSYHYSIPKWSLSCENLKEIHTTLLKTHEEEFTYNTINKRISCIDTTIYSEHWFRCPNQSKGNKNEGKHIIKTGIMKDFIISYIPNESINLNEYLKSYTPIKKQILKSNNYNKIASSSNTQIPSNNLISSDNTTIIVQNSDLILSTILSQPQIYKRIFDECYKQDRFELYNYWIKIGMAIKNIFGETEEGLILFDYYSSKGRNYEGYEKTKHKYMSFIHKMKKNGYTVATIYYYAIEDNKSKFIEIISKNIFELGQPDICKYIKLLAGNRFIYIKSNEVYKLYCYNGRYWETDDVLLRKYISTELYEFLKYILIEVYWNSKEFKQMKNQIDKIKSLSMKRDIIETYKEEGLLDIKFDDKWWLLGFNNIVYDMKECNFRDYQYDDYISITSGYDWREPTEEELTTINNLLNIIFPIEDERELYLQILSTGLNGLCLEKIIIANGEGGNGKGVINDLCLLALGNYGLIGNNSILFETNKTGSNPEKANINKKRLVIFREPPSKNKFENAILKELTGGGSFSARTHHEKTTQKELNLTMIVECNQKPLLSEEPQEAELRRIIDIYFRSSFTTDESLLDNKNNIYKANSLYKTKEWQELHKYALLKILIEKHKKYMNNNFILQIPLCIAERTKNYLELSCDIITWFKETFIFTGNKEDILKIKDIYEKFISSEDYNNFTKIQKRKYNKSFLIKYIETNKFFKGYYHSRYNNIRSVLTFWKLKEEDSEDEFIT